MAEIYAIVTAVGEAIKLCGNVQHNTEKSKSLIKCLQAVKAPLQAIDDAERDRIQVSHEETLTLLMEVIDDARALLKKQTENQNFGALAGVQRTGQNFILAALLKVHRSPRVVVFRA